jgi:hypothetical protein
MFTSRTLSSTFGKQGCEDKERAARLLYPTLQWRMTEHLQRQNTDKGAHEKRYQTGHFYFGLTTSLISPA